MFKSFSFLVILISVVDFFFPQFYFTFHSDLFNFNLILLSLLNRNVFFLTLIPSLETEAVDCVFSISMMMSITDNHQRGCYMPRQQFLKLIIHFIKNTLRVFRAKKKKSIQSKITNLCLPTHWFILIICLSVSLEYKDFRVQYCILFIYKFNEVPRTWYMEQANYLLSCYMFLQFMLPPFLVNKFFFLSTKLKQQ